MQVGLLVGRIAAGRDSVLEAVATPPRVSGSRRTANAAHQWLQSWCPAPDLLQSLLQDGLAAASLVGRQQPGAQATTTKRGGALTSQLALDIDQELVIDHAVQLGRSLPGGLSVCGVYVVCPEAAVPASSGALARLLRGIASEASSGPGHQRQEGQQGQHPPALVLLHADAASGRLGAKEVSAAQGQGKGSGLQPCELRVVGLRSQLVTLRAT